MKRTKAFRAFLILVVLITTVGCKQVEKDYPIQDILETESEVTEEVEVIPGPIYTKGMTNEEIQELIELDKGDETPGVTKSLI